MTLAPDALTAFEDRLEEWILRCQSDAPISVMVRAHFGYGEAGRRRGKRLRPHILLMVAQTEGARSGDADGPAIAIELLHNYSLIHDDIEDRDEIRHGRPTLWVRFGVPSAIVAGNAMCAMSYLALFSGAADIPPARRVAMERCLQRANFHMCEGQGLDIGFETAQLVVSGGLGARRETVGRPQHHRKGVQAHRRTRRCGRECRYCGIGSFGCAS